MIRPVPAAMAASVPLLTMVSERAFTCNHRGFRDICGGWLVMRFLGKGRECISIGTGPKLVPFSEGNRRGADAGVSDVPEVTDSKVDHDLKVGQLGTPFGIGDGTDAMAESFRGTIVEDVLQLDNIAAGESSVNKVKKGQADVFLEILTEPLPKRVVVVRWGVDE